MNDKSTLTANSQQQQVSFVFNKSKNSKTVLKVKEVSFSIISSSSESESVTTSSKCGFNKENAGGDPTGAHLRAKENDVTAGENMHLFDCSKMDVSLAVEEELKPAVLTGFVRPGGKPIQIGEKALAYLKDRQNEMASDQLSQGDSSMLEPAQVESKPAGRVGFLTGTGKSISLGDKGQAYLKSTAAKHQDADDDDLLANLDTSIASSIRPSKSFPENPVAAAATPLPGFSMCSGKPVVLGEKAQAILRAKQEEFAKEPLEPAVSAPPLEEPKPAIVDPPSEIKSVGFSTSSGKAIQIGDKAREYLQAKQREHFSTPLPEFKPKEELKPSPAPAPAPTAVTAPKIQGKKFIPHSMKPSSKSVVPKFYIVKPMFELTRTEVKANESTVLFDQNFLDNLDDSDDLETKMLLQDPSIGEVKNKNLVEAVRISALQSQKSRIEAKRNVSMTLGERSRPGHLFEAKSQRTRDNRVSLKQMREQLKDDGSSQPGRSDFNFHEKAIEHFKLNLEEYVDVNDYNQRGYVETPDGGHLVSDERFYAGVEELFNCFLDSNGVDVKLVDLTWFKNHLRWIAWKLDSYDRRLGSLNSASRQLDPINILVQMKYRYDVEVGNGKRSCVRKLIEKDDTPMNKLMVLFVSKANPQDLPYIELCDGWYPVRAQCDAYLASYVKSKRLCVGDKIVVYSSELVGCPKDGCPPLEAPGELYLRLSVNSTRKARWSAKLGFVRAQRPLCVQLETIKPNSNVGAVDVIVERIYPMLYLEKRPDGSKVFRNQRQEELYDYKHQMEVSQRFGEGASLNNKNPQGGDQNPPKRNVTQLIKMRLIDAGCGNLTPKTNSAILTVWQNASELRDKLNEGQRVIILNLGAVFQKNTFQDGSSLCLSTNRQSNFTFPPKSNEQTTFSSHLERFNCEYADIYSQRIISSYGEVDLCGIVVSHLENSYQNMVFLTNLDDCNQSVVCVLFQKNAEYHGFKDILKMANNVACLNLKFSRRLEKSKYPCLMASEMSVFTQKIAAYKHLTVAYAMLDEKIKSAGAEMRDRLKEMAEKIENDKSNYSMVNANLFNKSGPLDRSKGANGSYCTPKDNRVVSIAQIAEVSPIVSASKPGARHPGLTAKNVGSANSSSSTPRFLNTSRPGLNGTPGMPASNASTACSTPANNSSLSNGSKNPAALTSSFVANRLLKRTSDHLVKLDMNTTSLSEDEDDSIISNHDLEALFSHQPSNLSLAKRKKI